MKYFTIILSTLLLAAVIAPHQTNDFPEVVVPVEVHLNGQLYASGSGVVIDSFPVKDKFNTAVLTAKHNIDNIPIDGKVYVLLDGLKVPSHIAYRHPTMDAAVLVIETTEALTGALMDSSPLSPLEEVYTGGYQMAFELLITEGIVNYSVTKDLGQKPGTLWLCTAPTFPGNSGGGVFDKDSRKLIGLSVAVGSAPGPFGGTVVPHIHIFIPINVLDKWIDEVNHERQNS
tara:strand:+ start:46237 stop:46926 length:690 start_codon:yes stop_codon:yes gene_type:complete